MSEPEGAEPLLASGYPSTPPVYPPAGGVGSVPTGALWPGQVLPPPVLPGPAWAGPPPPTAVLVYPPVFVPLAPAQPPYGPGHPPYGYGYGYPGPVAVPSIALTLVITLFFNVFGVIPAAVHTTRARQLGRPTGRYWLTFGLTLAVPLLCYLLFFGLFWAVAVSGSVHS